MNIPEDRVQLKIDWYLLRDRFDAAVDFYAKERGCLLVVADTHCDKRREYLHRDSGLYAQTEGNRFEPGILFLTEEGKKYLGYLNRLFQIKIDETVLEGDYLSDVYSCPFLVCGACAYTKKASCEPNDIPKDCPWKNGVTSIIIKYKEES